MNIKELFKIFFPENKVMFLEDKIQLSKRYNRHKKNSSWIEQLKENLISKGFVCEIDLEDYLLQITINNSSDITLNCDAIRIYEKEGKICFVGFDYVDGVKKFEFSINKNSEIKLFADATEKKEQEIKPLKVFIIIKEL